MVLNIKLPGISLILISVAIVLSFYPRELSVKPSNEVYLYAGSMLNTKQSMNQSIQNWTIEYIKENYIKEIINQNKQVDLQKLTLIIYLMVWRNKIVNA